MENNAVTHHCQKTASPIHSSLLAHSFLHSADILEAIYFTPGSALGPGDTVENEVDMVSALIKISVLVGESR